MGTISSNSLSVVYPIAASLLLELGGQNDKHLIGSMGEGGRPAAYCRDLGDEPRGLPNNRGDE